MFDQPKKQATSLQFAAMVFVFKSLLISKEYGRPAYRDFRVQKARRDWLEVRRATAEKAEGGLGKEANKESIDELGDMVLHASRDKIWARGCS